MRFASKATWSAIVSGIAPEPSESASVRDVMRQRTALAEMSEAVENDHGINALLNHAARCAALGCSSPMAKVLELSAADDFLVVAGHYGLKDGTIGVRAGKAEPGNPPGEALARASPVTVDDLRTLSEEKVPQLLRDYNVVTTINVPLIGRNGPYGVLEVDYADRRSVGALELSFLALLAGLLAGAIERRREREFLIAERDAKSTLLREQQHRTRNNFQLILAMLHRNARASTDPQARKGFDDIARRVFAVTELYDHLLGLGEHGEEVDLSQYLSTMSDHFHSFYDFAAHRITLETNREHSVLTKLDVCTAVGTVVNELVANAVEHAFQGRPGRIWISLKQTSENEYSVAVSDNGCGFAPSGDESIGLRTARRLIAGVGGRLELKSDCDSGSTWTLSFPLSPSSSQQ